MDTKFWGPSGWKLLHSIAYTYPDKPTSEDKRHYGIFYSNLKFILPCKYCRKSLTGFYKTLPIEQHLENRRVITKWMYEIHNKVNNKLRRQGFLDEPNPELDYVDQLYKDIISIRCSLPGWDFIYCVVFNYPEKQQDISMDLANYYLTFFKYLGYVIPCKKYRSIYKKVYHLNPIEKALDSREHLIKWLYRINCHINQAFTEKNRSLKDIMESYEVFRAGCHTKKFKGSTCRSKMTKNLNNHKITKCKLKSTSTKPIQNNFIEKNYQRIIS